MTGIHETFICCYVHNIEIVAGGIGYIRNYLDY